MSALSQQLPARGTWPTYGRRRQTGPDREEQALAESTAAALEAADCIADLNTFLRQAAPQAKVLGDESATLRRELEQVRQVEEPPPRPG